MNAMSALLFLLLAGMLLESSETAKRLDNVQRLYQISLNQMTQKEKYLKLVGDQIGKKYYHKIHFTMNCKDALQVVESFLLPREAFNMKSTSKKLKNLQITGKLSLFPKENIVQVFRDMDYFPPKNEITWEDPKKLIPNEQKEHLEKCLRLAENDRPSCVFDEVSKWNPTAKLYPFFKEVLFAVLNAVDRERRKRGNGILLLKAIRFDAPEDVARLIKRKRDVNLEESLTERGYKPLHLATVRGDFKIVKILLEAGAEVDGRTAYEYTPLHLAVKSQNVLMIKLLLRKNANVNAVNRLGESPLHDAAENRDVEIVESLLKAGADVNAGDYHWMPLHCAAISGSVENVKILLKYGAGIDTQSKVKGRTALFYAAQNGKIRVVKALLNAGANTKKTSEFGATAVEIAEQKGHINCAAEIINFESFRNIS